MKIKSIKYFIFLIAIAAFFSCSNELTSVDFPDNDDYRLLDGTEMVDGAVKGFIEGVYVASYDSCLFGKDVVLKWNDSCLSCLSGKNCTYAILKSGQKDGAIILEGYWRYAQSFETGLISMTIGKENGASELLAGIQTDTVKIDCSTIVNNMLQQFTLIYLKPLPHSDRDFYIIGHRGGCRNIDRLPYSENSLGMIRYAEKLGANAIEIDVQLTKDSVPVLFHDENMSDRLVNQTSFIGKISDYTYSTLESFCSLKDGEKIPTLEEALQTIIEHTTLKLVWLDIKGMGTITTIAPMQRKYRELAKEKGIDLEILIGLPKACYFDEYMSLNIFDTNPTVSELDEEYVRKAKSAVWTPRWSLGLLNDRVEQMHQEGYRAFVWTIDDTQLVKRFLNQSKFDGICTNYPSVVAYEYYTAEQ